MDKFLNRADAGYQLAELLKKYKRTNTVLLAVPRGGVPVAEVIARELELPMELVLVKKIGHPLNKEYAIGAAGEEDEFILPHEGVSQNYIKEELKQVRNRLREMQQTFMGSKKTTNLRDKTVIVVDDGIATGNTMLATIRILKKMNPYKIIVAAPVISETAAQKLETECDEVISPRLASEFSGVGAFYFDFTQVSDEEVMNSLKNALLPQ